MLYLTPFITIYFCLLAAVLGACMGSFLACMAWRALHGESILKGRSHCDKCGHVLGAKDLVPVFSYLALNGRCRYCGAKMSQSFLWSEVVAALVFVSLLLRYDISLQTLEFLLLASVLMASAFADLEEYIIPDRFIIAGIAFRVIFILISGDALHEALESLLGGASVAAALLAVSLLLEKILKRDAMGGGDIKLLFLTGLYFGWQRNLLLLILACFAGILFGVVSMRAREKNEDAKLIPWGPSIAFAAWMTALFGQNVLNWYLSLF